MKDRDEEIIEILRKTLGEYRALLTVSAAVLLRKKKEERDHQEIAVLEAMEKYGIVKDDQRV